MEEEYFVEENPGMKDTDTPQKPYAIFRRFDGAVYFVQAHVFYHSANVFCKILNKGNTRGFEIKGMMLIKLVCGQCGYSENIEMKDQKLHTIICKCCGCSFGAQWLG